VTIGRDVLGNGGTAADAAVAMYFTMTVTLPSRVGIAGGGACLAHNSGLGFQEGDPFDEAYLFLPDPAAPGRPQLAGPRAMAVMHARHGAQRWELLLSEAERLARLGTGASRAFVTDLNAAATFVSASPDLKAAFSNRAGALASEGDEIIRPELSGLISGLRRQGAGYLYTGAVASRFAEAANGIGLPLTVQDLRETVPTVTAPLTVPYGDNVAYFPPLPASGGPLTAQMWGMLTEVEDYAGAGPAERAHLLAEAGQRAFAARVGWLGAGGTATGGNANSGGDLLSEAALERMMAGYRARQHNPAAVDATAVPAVSNPYTAGFVVADVWGSVVTCSFTMSGLFGDGRTVPGTGVILPKVAVPGADNLSTAIIGNPFNGTVYFAGTASGGLAAPAALTRVMLDSVEGGGDLQAAVAAPRVVNVGSPDVTYHEPTLDPAVLAALRERGHQLRAESGVGQANALFCPEGLRGAPGGCLVETDKRGHGLAVVAQ